MKKLCALIPLLFTFSSAALALSPEEIAESLKARLPQIEIREVKPAEVEGLYEVYLVGTQTLFVSEDGRHLIAGDLFMLPEEGGIVNLSDARRQQRDNELNEFRKETLAAFDESKMVVFSPAKDQVKKTITVFTDVTCGFCRKLHQDVPELNRLGIAVRYMAWPRTGINSPGYDQLVSAWCAKDPAKALTLAKIGQQIEPATCDNPVDEEYEIGRQFGVDATPALVLEDGSLIKGYRDAKSLAIAVGVPYEGS